MTFNFLGNCFLFSTGIFVDHEAEGVFLCVCCEEPLFEYASFYAISDLTKLNCLVMQFFEKIAC